MSTAYQQQFGRPLPAHIEEVDACAGCGSEGACECGAGSPRTVLTRRVDRTPFTKDDLKALFPERYK
jgi:hypothetical protein